jgi:hypothetical protein
MIWTTKLRFPTILIPSVSIDGTRMLSHFHTGRRFVVFQWLTLSACPLRFQLQPEPEELNPARLAELTEILEQLKPKKTDEVGEADKTKTDDE